MDAYGTPAGLGNFASISAALTYVQANKWDHKGDGTGYFQMGQFFYNSTEEQFYRAKWDSIWGDFYTYDQNLQNLNWAESPGNGTITNAATYTDFSGAAGGGCDFNNAPRKFLPLPPCTFQIVVKSEIIDTANAQYKVTGMGPIQSGDLTKRLFIAHYEQLGPQYWTYRDLNTAASGFVNVNVTTRWIQLIYHYDPNGPHWYCRNGPFTGVPPTDSELWTSDNGAFNTSPNIERWEADKIQISTWHGLPADDPAFQNRVSDFYFYRI